MAGQNKKTLWIVLGVVVLVVIGLVFVVFFFLQPRDSEEIFNEELFIESEEPGDREESRDNEFMANEATSTQKWCQAGSILQFKDTAVTVVGITEKSDIEVCHVEYTNEEDGTAVDYYLDQTALEKFLGGAGAAGSGCIVTGVKYSAAATEMCFGDL